MSFLWPDLLFLLLIVPGAVAIHIEMARRRQQRLRRFSNLRFAKEALGAGQQAWRRASSLLFLLALTLMLVAVARPTVVMTIPAQYDTVVLAIDTSASMAQEDVLPSRIAAAKAAAIGFAGELPRHTRIGVVSFANTASVVQGPTSDRNDIVAAIDLLELQPGTAIGSAILVSLAMVFPDIELDLLALDPNQGWMQGTAWRKESMSRSGGFKPVPPGSFRFAAIVLLTDGESTHGPDPIEAAKAAAERGVRIFTVGVGAAEAQAVYGRSKDAGFDEASLREIAAITNAQYFYAGNQPDLTKIYSTLNSLLVFEKKKIEITAGFALAAAVLAVVSGLLSLLQPGRMR